MRSRNSFTYLADSLNKQPRWRGTEKEIKRKIVLEKSAMATK